jgi:hypothetical protein
MGTAALIPVILPNYNVTIGDLVTPSLYGAQFAWPVTCVLFPLIGLVRQPATMSSVFALGACGALLGALTTYTRFATRLIFFVDERNQLDFVFASAIAGAVLGGVFGFCLWRFDLAYPLRGAKQRFDRSAVVIRFAIALGGTQKNKR